MSKVQLGSNSSASIFIINALAAKYGDNMFDKFGIEVGKTIVDVELTVNGEKIDFLESLNALLIEFDEATERHTLEKAKEMLSSSRLDSLSRKLSEFEWQIEDELRKLS